MAQLSQLKEIYNDGWEPKADPGTPAPCYIRIGFKPCWWLCFKSLEIKDEFENNFKDLIEKAKPLLV